MNTHESLDAIKQYLPEEIKDLDFIQSYTLGYCTNISVEIGEDLAEVFYYHNNETFEIELQTTFNSIEELKKWNSRISKTVQAINKCFEKYIHDAENSIEKCIFLKWNKEDFKGDITCVFPYRTFDCSGELKMCYAHIGQHSGCSIDVMRENNVVATPEEYKDLKYELEKHVGYTLEIMTKEEWENFK